MKTTKFKTLNYMCLIPFLSLPVIFWFTGMNVYRATKNQFKAFVITGIPSAISIVALVLFGCFAYENVPKWIASNVLGEIMQFILAYVLSIMLSIICVAIHKNYMGQVLEKKDYQKFSD